LGLKEARSVEYVVYGLSAERDSVALLSVLRAKGLACRRVEETASLSWVLASRAGSERPPFLRTPEGFVLAGLQVILDWVERMHPQPSLLPAVACPVRRASTRLLEDWIELWLPEWPRRSWRTLEGLGAHLDRSGYLLGSEPTRPDYLLAAWLETEVLVRPHARDHLAKNAPRLVSLGRELLDRAPSAAGPAATSTVDDAIPISLLAVLEEIARDYHAYLLANHAALKDRRSRLRLDLGLGKRELAVRADCEARRVALARELASLSLDDRRDVCRVLEPVGAWHVLTLPAVLEEIDPADPRSL
jgi:glutathione S-transferase